jgi:hypothetical protein
MRDAAKVSNTSQPTGSNAAEADRCLPKETGFRVLAQLDELDRHLTAGIKNTIFRRCSSTWANHISMKVSGFACCLSQYCPFTNHVTSGSGQFNSRTQDRLSLASYGSVTLSEKPNALTYPFSSGMVVKQLTIESVSVIALSRFAPSTV